MKPKKVNTPGSYNLGTKTPPRKRVGRPGSAKKPKKRQVKHRQTYEEEDILEAIRLVKEMGFSKLKAALRINSIKRNPVPRTTLINRLQSDEPESQPSLGRPQEN
jgi:hypothetical protein